jgi:hypothetical protein
MVPVNAKAGKTHIMAFAPRLDEGTTETLRSSKEEEDPEAFVEGTLMRNGSTVFFVTTYKY